MDGRATETVLGHYLYRYLHLIDRSKENPVGAIEHEGQLAITHTGLQVYHLACTDLQQLLNGYLTQSSDQLIAACTG